MVRFLFLLLWVVAASSLSGCGEDDKWGELKSRCVDWCDVFQRCSTNPADYDQCVSSCDAFDDAGSGAEFEDFFLCKEKCVKDATSDTECTCLLRPENGGPDC